MASEELFKEAQNAIKTRTDLSNADMLKVYALYKQATVGPNAGSRPGWTDPVGQKKYDAWKELGTMSKEDAKEGYCKVVDDFVPGWRSSGEEEEPSTEELIRRIPSGRLEAPAASSAPAFSKRKALFGWMKIFTEDSLDNDRSLFLAPNGEHVHAAHGIADKFILFCVLDKKVQPLYDEAIADLSQLKAHIVGVILAAVRSSDHAPAEPLSLDSHRNLSDSNIEALRNHLKTSVKEYYASGERTALTERDMRERLMRCPTIPIGLLPRRQETEVKTQATNIKKKGADDESSRNLGGIEFAPFFNVPFRRRRQMVACTIGSMMIFEAAALFLVSLFFWRWTWPILLPYLAWIAIDKSPWKGGMKFSPGLRRLALWRNWGAYFPASLIKSNPEADFSGKRPVMMGYHPHGILSFGAVLNIGTEATGWSEKFPKLTPRLCTLNMNFYFPFLREVIGRMGCIPASAGSIKKALKPGNAVVIVVGGAAEALDTKPGQYVLTLARRSGFFRLALEHGADLVPSFGFGENDIYETYEPKEDSLMRHIQLKAYKALSFSMPFFYGRTMFTYNAGWLPYRRPLTVVVGDPIRVEKTEAPTQEQIEALKAQYIAAVRNLFNEWQPRLEPGREASLVIS